MELRHVYLYVMYAYTYIHLRDALMLCEPPLQKAAAKSPQRASGSRFPDPEEEDAVKP